MLDFLKKNWFNIQLISLTFLHFIDIGTDIYFLIEFKNHLWKSYFFPLSLSIIILSFFSSAIQLKRNQHIENTNLELLIDFLLGFFQIKFLTNIYESYKLGKMTDSLLELRLNESLLESTPQSLLQLHIFLLEWADEFYYIMFLISIILSLISVAYAMVSYEIETFNNLYEKSHSNLSVFSKYGIILSLYRITEIVSRIFLLGMIGINNTLLDKTDNLDLVWGSSVLLLISADFFIANIFDIIYYSKKIVTYVESLNDSFYEENGDLKLVKDFWIAVFNILDRMKYLAVYYKPFIIDHVENEEITSETSVDCFYIRFKYMHFFSKFINNYTIVGFLIYDLINYNISEVYLIPIYIGIISLVLNNIFLLIILKCYEPEKFKNSLTNNLEILSTQE